MSFKALNANGTRQNKATMLIRLSILLGSVLNKDTKKVGKSSYTPLFIVGIKVFAMEAGAVAAATDNA